MRFQGGTRIGTLFSGKSRSMTALRPGKLCEHDRCRPVRPELGFLLAWRRVVAMRPAMHRDRDEGLAGKPDGQCFAGERRDHCQRQRDRMPAGEREQAIERGGRLDGIVVAQPQIGGTSGLPPALQFADERLPDGVVSHVALPR